MCPRLGAILEKIKYIIKALERYKLADKFSKKEYRLCFSYNLQQLWCVPVWAPFRQLFLLQNEEEVVLWTCLPNSIIVSLPQMLGAILEEIKYQIS